MMVPEIFGDIAVYGVSFVTTGITIILTMAGFYLHRNYQNSKLTQVLFILDQIVINVVQELNQTVVEDLKAASVDGKLTRDEAEQIKHKAIEMVLKRLGGNMLKTIQINMGPITNLLATKIEAAVFDAKRSKKARTRVGRARSALAQVK
jgi:hypothetical protein